MNRHRVVAAWLAVGVMIVIGLTGCSGSTSTDSPTTAGTTVPSTTAATTQPSTVAPPVAPKAAATPKSAEAFVRYFWALYNYSYNSQDSKQFQSVSDPNCKFCQGVIDEISHSKTRHLHTQGGNVTVLAIAASPGKIGDSVVISSVLSQDPGTTSSQDNQVISTSEKIDAIESTARLDWSQGTWHMDALNIKRKKS